MKVEECMTKNVAVADPDMSLEKIAQMMRDQNCGSIPVAHDNKLIGMVTDRDIVIRCLAEGKDPARLTAEDIMTNKIFYCYSDQDTEEVARNMAENMIRREPVMDRQKNLVGIVSFGNLAHGNQDAVTGACLKNIYRAA